MVLAVLAAILIASPSGNTAVTIIGLVLLAVVSVAFPILEWLRSRYPADIARGPVDLGCGAAKLFEQIQSELLLSATGNLTSELQLNLGPSELVDVIRKAILLLTLDVQRALTFGPRKVLTSAVTLQQLRSHLPGTFGDTVLEPGQSLELSVIGPSPAKRSSDIAIRLVANRYGLTPRIIAELSRLRPDSQ